MTLSPRQSLPVRSMHIRLWGVGFWRRLYENALRLELERQGLQVAQQAPIKVWYAGHIVGDYYADLWVEGKVIVELKAALNLCKEHEIQLVNYLTATNIEIGLLVNFGPSVQVKRKYREYKPRGV